MAGHEPSKPQVISAGIDNEIKIWDLRKNAVVTEIGQEEVLVIAW